MVDTIITLLFVLLNYFWLSDDPEESAAWYCDQHCFKLGSEVIESVWDAVLVLKPSLAKLATESGIPENNRKRRHSKPDGLWHPFSVWNGYCKANMHRSLVNADAIFKEHKSRTGKEHSAWQDCKFLLDHVDSINFNTKTWYQWFESQNGTPDSEFTPSKTKPKDLERRRDWCKQYGLTDSRKLNRNTCPMTIPGQYINEKQAEFAGCQVPGDHVAAYRKYYNAKATTVNGGMRYFYTKPPSWLSKEAKAKLVTERASKAKKSVKKDMPPKKCENKYLLDDEGYVVVEFV